MAGETDIDLEKVARTNKRVGIAFASIFLIVSLLVLFNNFGGFDYVKRERQKKVGMSLAAASLNDPETAQFRNVYVTEYSNVVCGEINGKNLYGAYTGFSKFFVRDGEVKMEPVKHIEINDDMKTVNNLEEAMFGYDIWCKQ